MIEKKVGNVTLRMSDQGAPVNVWLGELVVRTIPPMGMIPDFGPEVVAAIEDLRKPLAENEGWVWGIRVSFCLRDTDGAGIAATEDDEYYYECVEDGYPISWPDESLEDDGNHETKRKLNTWAEKERGRWTFERNNPAAGQRYVAIHFDGKCGFGIAQGNGGICYRGSTPAWASTKAQAEYEAMVRERKPKKPSERLAVVFSGDHGTPYFKEVLSILDELAEKVGGL
jgi:hypothetical protein